MSHRAGRAAGLLGRAGAAVLVTVALVAGGLAAAAPAAALSSVAYSAQVPSSVRVGDRITLGLSCPSGCPAGVTAASVTISGGPTLDLPADPDYEVDWQVQGIASGTDAAPVSHTVTVSFTDETGSVRTLAKQMRVDKDSPQYVGALTPHDGMDASVTWDAPAIDGGSAITGYKVQVDGDPWVSLASTARAFSLSGLAYGPHEVRVIAVNAIGWGWGDPVTVLRGVLPSAPVVSVTGIVHPTLTWTESVGGGIDVTGYTVYADGAAVVSLGPTARSVTLSHLDPGVQDLQVAADSWLGAGDFSDPVEWVQASVPSPVSTPLVTAGPGSLTVAWEAPSDDGGMAVTSYDVRVVDAFTGTVLRTASAAGTTVTVSGLLDGFKVLAQVAARNAVGASEWTDAATTVAPNGTRPTATTLSLRASDTTPTATQKVVLAGTLAVPGKAETSQRVQIWIRPFGSASWTRATTLTLGSTGAWRYSRTFRTTTMVMARYLGSVHLAAAQANSSILTVRPAVTVSARTTTSSWSPRTVFPLGSTVYAAASTAGAPVGAVAKLQRRKGSSWITVATASLSGGRARLHWKPTARGTYALRVAVPGGSSVRTGLSATLVVRVA